MSSFTRYAAVAAVVLSLGLFVVALPAIRADISVPAITGKDGVSLVCAQAVAKIVVAINDLLGCGTLVELDAHVKVLVALFQACTDDLLKVGAEVKVTAEAQASIVACFAALIKLVVHVCLQISVKFGLTAVLSLCAEIDVALRACVESLNLCVGGILELLVNAVIDINATALVQLGFNNVISILGLSVSL